MNPRPIVARRSRPGRLAGGVLALCLALPALAQPPAPEAPKDQPKPATGEAPKATDNWKDPETKVLQIGDKAPAFKVASWAKGGPIDSLAPGKAHVLLFWATHSRWAGEALAKLADVQGRFKPEELDAVAISLWERAVPAPGDDFSGRVSAYVKEHGSAWPFAVAYDGDFGEMNTNWMHAADRRWIPTVFVVDRAGIIAWIGHPLDERDRLEDVVGKVVAGTWDIPAAAAQAKRDADVRVRLRQAERAWDMARRAGDKTEMMKRCRELFEGNIAQGSAKLPGTLEGVFVDEANPAAAYAWLAALMEGPASGDSMALNTAAWFILDHEGVTQRDLPLAMTLAKRASAVSGARNAAIEDTLARAYADTGDLDKAIEIQTRAVELAAPDASIRTGLAATLEKYKQRKASGK